MNPSSKVAAALVRFYDVFGTASATAFDRVVVADADAMVVPSDRGPARRDAWQQVFASLTGVRLEPGPVQAFEQGGVGWAVDTPTAVTHDGRRLPVRLTAVACEQEGTWKLVQLHVSVAVPDELAFAEAEGWADTPSA